MCIRDRFKFPQLTHNVFYSGPSSRWTRARFPHYIWLPHLQYSGGASPCFWFGISLTGLLLNGIDSFSLSILYQLEMIPTSWINSPYTFMTRRLHRWWFFKTWRRVGRPSHPSISLYVMISLGTQIKSWPQGLSLVNGMFLLLQLENNLWYHAFTQCQHSFYPDFNIH